MNKILLFLSFASFCFLTACGYNNGTSGSGGGGGVTLQGNFSVASLSGQYTFQASGTVIGVSSGGQFTESAILSADGKGNISNGTEDVVPGSGLSGTFTGTYTLANDGTGFLTFNTGEEFAITMVSSSKFYLSEVDGTANLSGVGEQQSASALTAVPNGTFAFKVHSNGALLNSTQVSIAQVGAMTVSSGTFTGIEDMLASGGSASALSFTGAFNAPVSGRGTGTLNDSNGTLSFEYYIVNANTINIMPIALNAVSIFGTGRVESQTGGPFSGTSLSGGYAFGSKGDTASIGGLQRVGQFDASNGTISSGAEDFVLNGASGLNDAFSGGNYTVTSNGRATLNLTSTSLGTLSEILWMVNPTRAFVLVNSSTAVEDGTMDAQASSSFTTNGLTGQSAFFMGGFNTLVFADRIGTLTWSNGNVTANLVEIDTGSASSGSTTATYAVGSNGRTTMSIAGLPSVATANFVFYLTSGSSGYLLENDTNTEIGGAMALQSQ